MKRSRGREAEVRREASVAAGFSLRASDKSGSGERIRLSGQISGTATPNPILLPAHSSGKMRGLLAVLALMAATLSQADQAVVVAVQEYVPLVSASTLRGCINDATAIKDILERNKFKVTMLTNQQATKLGILGAIAKCGKTMSRTERFVFYFAGHGRRTPHPALMPHDATSDGNDLTTDELNTSLLKIQAKSRTVILDACFSGGMAAGEMARGIYDDPFKIKARYWEPPQEQSRSLTFGPAKSKANNQDTNAKLENGTGICYYTACTANEQALEGNFDGQRHGLFTYGLMNHLKDDKKPWGEVHSEVKGQMQQKLEKAGRQQNPTISKDYMNAHALENDIAKPVPPKPTKSLLDIWNLDNPDPKKISVEMNPNETGYEVGRKIKMTVTVGQPGYLVILGQVDGQFYQFYPQGKYSARDAEVKAGKLEFPTNNNNLFFDSFGADQVKAILLPTPEKAQQVLDATRTSQGVTASEATQKDLVMARSINEPEYTSRVSVSLSDKLIGGSRFKSLDGLLKKIARRSDPVSQHLWDAMAEQATYSKAQRWMADFDVNAPVDLKSKQQFVTLLNLAMQTSAGIYDEGAFAGVKLSQKTKDLIKKKPQGDDLIRLNRMLLIDAYPAEVNPDDTGGK
jgi:hypothetical protein